MSAIVEMDAEKLTRMTRVTESSKDVYFITTEPAAAQLRMEVANKDIRNSQIETSKFLPGYKMVGGRLSTF